MFGFSFSKFLLAAVVVWLVWRVYFQRRGLPQRRNPFAPPSPPPSGSNPSQPPTVDLIQCPTCGNYLAKGSTCSCGYKDRG